MHKKTLIFSVVLAISLPLSTLAANELGHNQLTRLYENGLTKYTSLEDFRTEDTFTREQAAKFYSQFAVRVLGKSPDTNLPCIFEDINDADQTLKNDIITACQLGIFKGSKGKFNPKNTLLSYEAISVFIRTIIGKSDETIQPRYQNYIAKAGALGILPSNQLSLEAPLSRGSIAYMIYMAKGGDFKTINALPGMLNNPSVVSLWTRMMSGTREYKVARDRSSHGDTGDTGWPLSSSQMSTGDQKLFDFKVIFPMQAPQLLHESKKYIYIKVSFDEIVSSNSNFAGGKSTLYDRVLRYDKDNKNIDMLDTAGGQVIAITDTYTVYYLGTCKGADCLYGKGTLVMKNRNTNKKAEIYGAGYYNINETDGKLYFYKYEVISNSDKQIGDLSSIELP